MSESNGDLLGRMGASANGQGARCRPPVANREDRSARSDWMIASHKPADVTLGSGKGSTRFGEFLGFGAGRAGTFRTEYESEGRVRGKGDIKVVGMGVGLEECEHGTKSRSREAGEVCKALGRVGPAGADEAVVAALREPVVMGGRWWAMRPGQVWGPDAGGLLQIDVWPEEEVAGEAG